MSAPTSRGEALRKEGVFVPASKGANPQNPRKTGDKKDRGKHNVTPKEKEQIMENNTSPVTAPVVVGTPANPAPVAAPVAEPANPIYTMRRAGGMAIDTLVVVATTSAILGAGYGIYRVATKAK